MNLAVLDASVVAQWFFPEAGGDAARALLPESDREFMAPDLLVAEWGNMLWKKVKKGELRPGEGRALLADIAHRLSVSLDITFYDALYAALALQTRSRLLTADRRLFLVLERNRRFRSHVGYLG